MQPNIETITGNQLSIKNDSLIAKNISFQINNIVSLSVKKAPILWRTFYSLISEWTPFIEVCGLLLFWPVYIPFKVVQLIYRSLHREYRLHLVTNASTSFIILNDDEVFLFRVKRAIESALKSPSETYFIDMAHHLAQTLLAEMRLTLIKQVTYPLSSRDYLM